VTDPADAQRALVLSRVRRALGRGTPDPAAAAPAGDAVDARIGHPRANTIPLRAQLQQPQLGELFDEMVRASAATLARVPALDALPDAVAAWRAEQGIEGEVVLAPESPLGELPWRDELPVERRLIRSGDAVSVSSAAVGVAETGTLLLCSGPENPVSANFLPENQVVVVRSADLVGSPEDAWARLRERGPLPRTVNWITGPSRSGDIEMTMLMGAHGPVRLHVVLVEEG
jgi:L-lactate dehydrogenase complex protein LldG